MARRRSRDAQISAAERTRNELPDFRPDGDQVLIRMYGQGLGDCFLLAFPRTQVAGAVTPATSRRPVYVLIDCGVVGGTPDGPRRMKEVVRDIKETTLDSAVQDAAGKPKGHLDLLIITHEHWDHLSGFVQAAEEWQQIQVDALWTAWTERNDPSGLPEVLRKIVERQRRALAQVADRALRFGLSDRHQTVLGLMSFLSDAAADGLAFAAAPSVRDAFDAAKKLVPVADHTCCEPGEVRFLPGTDVVGYVLGPPRSDERLRQLNPSRQASETFDEEEGASTRSAARRRDGPTLSALDQVFSMRRMSEGRSAFNAFAMPLLGPTLAIADGDPVNPGDDAGTAGSSPDVPTSMDLAAENDIYERSFPFDRSVRIPLPVAERAAESSAAFPALASYYNEINHWRRIDFDWLAPAEAFALRADNLTNNTSLVLAFELPPAGVGAERKVLLFVGDAQVGNWRSWDEIPTWQPQAGANPGQDKPDIADLLKRTIFYKVGHHGSHNATPKANGVERMRDDRSLTAFVPVSPPVAREIKDWCQMPLDAMLNALSRRTGGRVVLSGGSIWPFEGEDQVGQSPTPIELAVSSTMLPPKVRARDGKEIEGAVPLWVQIAIDY